MIFIIIRHHHLHECVHFTAPLQWSFDEFLFLGWGRGWGEGGRNQSFLSKIIVLVNILLDNCDLWSTH